MSKETIFALATPAARSGVAIIRISGPQALPALVTLTGKADWQPRLAASSVICHPSTGEAIDNGLALYFAGPRSFTGEDVVELHLHGSLAVIRQMLDVLAGFDGLRMAEPGEFTRRAFMHGKMDLIEAEGLADLIASETPAQKSQAQRQMQGDMSRYFDSLRAQIITALAHLEAYIDFPEEEIPEAVLHGLEGEIAGIKDTIGRALADGGRGEKLRDGLSIVILGAPNAGKSSLLNAIAGRDAAIVSHRAGTTRDVIEIRMEIAGFPVILMDTAGLRETADDIEEEGVRRALQRAAAADIKLVLFDASQPIDDQSRKWIDDRSLVIMNKTDLLRPPAESVDSSLAGDFPGMIPISIAANTGMDALFERLGLHIAQRFAGAAAPMITRTRHRMLLEAAINHLKQIDFSAPLEIICEELRLSATYVAKITGKIAPDDVLDIVFKQFCIGK